MEFFFDRDAMKNALALPWEFVYTDGIEGYEGYNLGEPTVTADQFYAFQAETKGPEKQVIQANQINSATYHAVSPGIAARIAALGFSAPGA